MRQIRMDELTYCLFSGMRKWSVADKKGIAGNALGLIDKRQAAKAAAKLPPNLYGCEFYDDPSAAPLTMPKLVEVLGKAIVDWPLDIRRGFLGRTEGAQGWARYYAAHHLAEQLTHLTVLRDSPEPPMIRFANFEGGSGVPQEAPEEVDRRSGR